MPIRSLSADAVEQHCVGCDESRCLSLDALGVTLVEEDLVASVVVLPACPECGSVEFLFGSSETAGEHPDLGSFGHLHRLLVDRLHAQLLDAGQVHPPSVASKV